MKYSVEDVKRLVPEEGLQKIILEWKIKPSMPLPPFYVALLTTRRQLELAREALSDAREVLDVGGARHVLGVDKAMALIKKVDHTLDTIKKEGES